MPSQDAGTSSALTVTEDVGAQSHVDVELVLDMLREYTRKLRDTYKGLEEKPQLGKDRVILAYALCALVISVGLWILGYFKVFSISLFSPIPLVVVLPFIWGGAIGVIFGRGVSILRLRKQSDRDELIVHAAALARLIRTASRMHEHGATRGFAQALALDLKLGEAEVVLQHAMRNIDSFEAERIDLIASGGEVRVGYTPRVPTVMRGSPRPS